MVREVLFVDRGECDPNKRKMDWLPFDGAWQDVIRERVSSCEDYTIAFTLEKGGQYYGGYFVASCPPNHTLPLYQNMIVDFIEDGLAYEASAAAAAGVSYEEWFLMNIRERAEKAIEDRGPLGTLH